MLVLCLSRKKLGSSDTLSFAPVAGYGPPARSLAGGIPSIGYCMWLLLMDAIIHASHSSKIKNPLVRIPRLPLPLAAPNSTCACFFLAQLSFFQHPTIVALETLPPWISWPRESRDVVPGNVFSFLKSFVFGVVRPSRGMARVQARDLPRIWNTSILRTCFCAGSFPPAGDNPLSLQGPDR